MAASVTVRVPGSTSNLGSGFDWAGMAVERWLELSARCADDRAAPAVTIDRRGALRGLSVRPEEDFVYQGFAAACRMGRREVPRLTLTADSDIPVGRGLGSSAAAVVAGAAERGVRPVAVQGFASRTGRGVTGIVEGRRVALGNPALLDELGADPGSLAARAEALRADGQGVVFVAVDRRVVGLLGVSDPIKASTPEALRLLRDDRVRVVMVTGDSRTTAEAVARKLGLGDVRAEVPPERKVEVVAQLQAAGRVVAFAGDGINDAPALARADVGIAMGSGTDVAIEAAAITLVKGDLRGIARARRLSRATMRNIRQNLFSAFVYNVLGIPVAAGVLYPFTGLLLNPMIAAAAMSFSSVSVIGNALRLRRVPL